MKRILLTLASVVLLIASLGMIQGCSENENPVESVMTDVGGDQNDVDSLLLTDLSQFDVNDRYEAMFGDQRDVTPKTSSSWWSGLSQSSRNYQIILEALYSVNRNIWGQNRYIPCRWEYYLQGRCALVGNWDYSNRSNKIGWGGWCKAHVQELIGRASGNHASLPSGYDYRDKYLSRNKNDAIKSAQPGEVMQFTGTGLHTMVIISNMGNGWFEVVDSNWSSPYDYKIRKHVINIKDTSKWWGRATVWSYVITAA